MSKNLMENLGRLPVPTPSNSARPWWRTPAVLLLLGALLSSAAAWWLIAWPVMIFANVATHPEHFGLVYAHMIGGTIMLFIGAINLYIGTTSRYFKYHKLFGRTSLIGGTIGVAF